MPLPAFTAAIGQAARCVVAMLRPLDEPVPPVVVAVLVQLFVGGVAVLLPEADEAGALVVEQRYRGAEPSSMMMISSAGRV